MPSSGSTGRSWPGDLLVNVLGECVRRRRLLSPASDNGSLVQNGNGTFTYCTPDGQGWQFDADGKQTAWVSADGSGLQYNRARWYDPSSGRWTSEDSQGFGADDPNTSMTNFASARTCGKTC